MDAGVLAERKGFEPLVRRTVRRISNPVLSTTQPSLRADSAIDQVVKFLARGAIADSRFLSRLVIARKERHSNHIPNAPALENGTVGAGLAVTGGVARISGAGSACWLCAVVAAATRDIRRVGGDDA